MILQIFCTLVNLTMKIRRKHVNLTKELFHDDGKKICVDQGSGTCLAQGAMKPKYF